MFQSYAQYYDQFCTWLINCNKDLKFLKAKHTNYNSDDHILMKFKML